MLHSIRITVIAFLFSCTTTAFAFVEDICFRKNANESDIAKREVINCIPLPDKCRTDNVSLSTLLRCKAISVLDVISAPRRANHVAGSRSLLHMDATYYLAQLIGFPAADAYQIAIYDQASDSGDYVPFDKNQQAMLSEEELQNCKTNRTTKCLLTTPSLNGLVRHNLATGGLIVHIGARYAAKVTPPEVYPTDYFAHPEIEKILFNLKDWVYGSSPAICVAGLTDEQGNCLKSTPKSPKKIQGHVPFLAMDKLEFLDINVDLGDMIINSDFDVQGNIIKDSIVYSSAIDRYVQPQKGSNAKLGIFLHSLQDRYSHHKCNDLSYYMPDTMGQNNYKIVYDKKYCDQGTHLLGHAWEVGTDQNQMTDPSDRTLKPALSATYDQLLEYAKSHGVTVNKNLDKESIINDLVARLEVEDAKTRLSLIIKLFKENGLEYLPGYD